MGRGVRDLNHFTRDLEIAAAGSFRRFLHQQLERVRLAGEETARLAATTRLRVRTGRLRNSITSQLQRREGAFEITLSAGGGRRPVEYAAAQEYGASIRPRRGRYLAIPLPGALTAAGALRARFAVPGGLRMVGGLFAVRGRSGRMLLVEKKGKGIQPLFVLHPGPIRIREKAFLRSGILRMERELAQALAGAVTLAVTP